MLFAVGPVNSAGREFATTFEPDGRVVYFNRILESGAIPIFRSRFEDGAWSPARPVEFTDERFLDVDPFVSPDGQRLYFTTDRSEGPEASEDFDIWMAERDGDGWAAPTRLPSPPNSPASEAFVSVTRDGTLYFGSRNTPDGSRRVLASRPVDGVYGPAEEVDLGIPAGVLAGNPMVLPDESAIVFTSRTDAGDVDLYVSFRKPDGSWQAARRLAAPINSEQADFAPGLGPGGALFFSSERPGVVPAPEGDERPPGDLYYVAWPPATR